ncbi:ABC transporter substrate-binding protein [Macrococcus equi]|uniref:ABC transporter substrate-binding protein n=1 Tax=Macrococcus equi TaxID=3395462 RepID=UPI0039BEBE58
MSILINAFMRSIDNKDVISIDDLYLLFKTRDQQAIQIYLNNLKTHGVIHFEKVNHGYIIDKVDNNTENIIAYLEDNLDDITLDDWKMFLELDWWGPDSHDRFTSLFHQKFPDEDYSMVEYIEPYPLKPTTFNPLEINDEYTSNLLCNIYDRLFEYDSVGNIKPLLVHYYELDDHVLKLYLKKGVKFHDGTILTAKDVINNLRALFQSPKYAFYKDNVLSIEQLSQNELQIVMRATSTMILNILATDHASIFKDEGSFYVGTGPFYFGHDYLTHSEMYAFTEYHLGRPFIDKVKNLQVPINYYRDEKCENLIDNYHIQAVDMYYNLMMVVFNVHTTNIQDVQLRHYITTIIHHHINYFVALSRTFKPNYTGFFQDSNTHQYETPEKNQYKNKVIRVAIFDNLNQSGETLAALLESYGCIVERVYYTFEDFIRKDLKDLNVDVFFWMYSFFNQPDYAFYTFLTTAVREIVEQHSSLSVLVKQFESAKLEEKHAINLKIEEILIEQNLIVPMIQNKRQITVPVTIKDYRIKANGFIDYRTITL